LRIEIDQHGIGRLQASRKSSCLLRAPPPNLGI
jgi:hypothetical protein